MDPERKAKMLAARARTKQETEEGVALRRAYDATRNAVPPEERTYFKRAPIEATYQDLDNDSWSGGRNVWKGEDGKYYKMAVVPATAEEYDNSLWSGGGSVWRDK